MDGGAGFWIFIAAMVVGGMWYDSRQKAEKHETLRRIMEKTGTIDEAKLKELFSATSTSESSGKPGGGYRALRVLGTMVMFLGAGIAAFFTLMGLLSNVSGKEIAVPIGLSVAAGVVLFGAGMFFASRFAEPPPGVRNGPPAP